jgi:hypothetical protein
MADGTVISGITPAKSDRALWRGSEIAQSGDWRFPLSGEAAAEIRACMEPFKGKDISPDGLTEADFPAPVLGAELAPLAQEISDHGLGFAVLKGVPIDGFSGRDFEIIHWAIGKAIGLVVTQGGSLGYIAHVRDLGQNVAKTYYAQVGGPLPMHKDPIDLAALLCLKAGRSGGTNLLVSAAALHNHLLERRPEILERLYKGYFHSSQPEETGDPGITRERLPLFIQQNGHTFANYLQAPIYRAVESGKVSLSAAEKDALEVFDAEALSEDLTIAIDAEPGDVLFLNNRTVLHSRTHYEDFDALEDRRHLLRVWMNMPEWDRLPPGSFHYAMSDDGKKKIFMPDLLGAG